jgi:hypothetical protein
MTRPQVDRVQKKEKAVLCDPKSRYEIKVIPGLFVYHRMRMFNSLIQELISEVQSGRA